MGQCFSFVLGSGPRKGKSERVHRGSTESTKSFSRASRSTTGFSSRRDKRRKSATERLSNATDECEVEAASGFFSMSDFSAAASSSSNTPTGPHRTFGRLLAQETKDEALGKSADHRRLSPEKSSPSSSNASGAGHRRNSSADRKSGGLTPSPSLSVADAMNLKGRRSLERLRQLQPDDPRNHRKSRSGRHERSESKQPPGPVDFDFLVQKASVDNSRTPSQVRRDVKRSAPADLQENDYESAHISSSSAIDLDDLSKSYRKSAAKAAARDRDAFKYIKSSSENEVSVTSSMGMSPAAGSRRIRHIRNASSHSVLDEEVRETRSSQTRLKHVGADRRRKAVSSPIPRSGAHVRNISSPSVPQDTPPVEAKPVVGIPRIRSSPGRLHRTGTGDRQVPERPKQGEAAFISRAGKPSSSNRSSAPSRKVGSTVPNR